MSQDTVIEVLTKALVDTGFRDRLFAEPDTVLSGYDLTEEETEALSGMKRETFDALATEIERRISKETLPPIVESGLISRKEFLIKSELRSLNLERLFWR